MSLPTPYEPLRLADGRIVHPGGDIADAHHPAPYEKEEEGSERKIIRRTESDLPAPARQMNAIAVVLSYVLFGLDDDTICSTSGLSPYQITQIRQSDAYRQLHDAVVRSVLDSEADVVRELLAKNAKRAARTMVDALDAGTRADRMAAARDILDRSGHRPADVVEHRHRMDGGLVIEVVKRDDTAKMPTIEVDP
jgi:hypothetical protein